MPLISKISNYSFSKLENIAAVNASIRKAWVARQAFPGVCTFNIDGLFMVTCSTLLIVLTLIILWRSLRRRSAVFKSPPVILYYMAKTAFHPDHYQICKQRIQKENYDVNFYDPDEKLSLFLCACLSGNADLVAFMIEKGANVHSISLYGDTALYLAVFGCLNSKAPFAKLLHLLLEAGCDINRQNDGGFTALHLATLKRRLDIVRYLILHGANPSIRSSDGVLPVDIALLKGHRDIAEFFIARKQRPNTSESVYF